MSPNSYFLDRSNRTRLEVTGPDRAKFLHNLTTNDVKRLAVGHGQESFITSPQGKTLGYLTVLATDDRLLLRTDPDGFSTALPHLQKYGIFDEVALEDVSNATFEYHVVGTPAEEWLRSKGVALPEPGEYRHTPARLGESDVRLIRESSLGESGLTVIGKVADEAAVSALLQTIGLADLDATAAERLRINAGVPAFGVDINPNNLPQEVARDAQAINFVKGCYLGQETVARIDALGHVNKLLVGLVLTGEGEAPRAGDSLQVDEKTVGTITSVVESEEKGVFVALGYIKATHATAGTTARVLNAAGGTTPLSAAVTDFPLRSVVSR